MFSFLLRLSPQVLHPVKVSLGPLSLTARTSPFMYGLLGSSSCSPINLVRSMASPLVYIFSNCFHIYFNDGGCRPPIGYRSHPLISVLCKLRYNTLREIQEFVDRSFSLSPSCHASCCLSSSAPVDPTVANTMPKGTYTQEASWSARPLDFNTERTTPGPKIWTILQQAWPLRSSTRVPTWDSREALAIH